MNASFSLQHLAQGDWIRDRKGSKILCTTVLEARRSKVLHPSRGRLVGESNPPRAQIKGMANLPGHYNSAIVVPGLFVAVGGIGASKTLQSR